jgi:hypothetical protein
MMSFGGGLGIVVKGGVKDKEAPYVFRKTVHSRYQSRKWIEES